MWNPICPARSRPLSLPLPSLPPLPPPIFLGSLSIFVTLSSLLFSFLVKSKIEKNNREISKWQFDLSKINFYGFSESSFLFFKNKIKKTRNTKEARMVKSFTLIILHKIQIHFLLFSFNYESISTITGSLYASLNLACTSVQSNPLSPSLTLPCSISLNAGGNSLIGRYLDLVLYFFVVYCPTKKVIKGRGSVSMAPKIICKWT